MFMKSSPTMASSSSFDDSQTKHDVFISFSGKDTRRGFLSHLVKELRRGNILAYVDENLNRGEEISFSLLRAIKESQISIVIFSKNYASSRWCLDELEEIIKCMKVNKQSVLPVFYYIDPSDVRHQIGAYKDAFADHKLKFQGDKKKLQNWRSALKDAAGLSGFVAANYNDDSELIEEIVKDVLLRVKDIYPCESTDLVGIDQHLDRIRSFLEKESKEVQILGIWGMSGIGKTTIAQAAYDAFSSHYEGSCFLDNVREESQKHGMKSLRQKLISVLQEEKSTFPQKRLINRRKVFVVLDDVRTARQLQDLLTEGIRLGPGSRIIVTSQSKKALIVGGVHDIHVVKELDFEESLKLFSLNAFKNSQPEKGYEELSKRAVGYAKGLPLALKVLGSCLYSEDRETWKSTMRKLELYPHHEIQDVLKMSFEGLDGVERDTFLDIAFFYKGEDKDHVMSVLDANNLFAACGIKGLLDKALVSISSDNIIQMHDLIQEMGWEMVRQECKENPGKRSRLKDFEEVYDVLKNNKGTDAIKGIVLYASLFKDVKLNVDTFKSMPNLRLVKFYSPWHVRFCNVHHPTSFNSFSDELRRLKMDGYPSKSLPLISYPEKLVEHSMPNSHVKKLQKLVQDFANSKRISLGRSKQSMELLDFTKAHKTKWGDICCCQRFCDVNSYILSLSMIAALNLVRSKDSGTLHSESNLRSLRNFDVGLCSSLTLFSLSSSKETSESDLVASIIEILSSSIGGVSELRRIIHGDSRLEILPIIELSCLRSFQELHLSDSRQLNQTPELHILFDALLYLQEQFMARCSVFLKSLDRIGTFPSKYLMVLSIYWTLPEIVSTISTCTLLEDSFRYFFPFLNQVELDMYSSHNIMEILKGAFHTNFGVSAGAFVISSSEFLMKLVTKQTTKATSNIIGTCSSLKYLGLNGCSIDSFPASITNLPLLEKIDLRNCSRLQRIATLPLSIMHLDATNCISLKSVSFTTTTSITTSAPQRTNNLSYFFSFVNCMKLDEHSLCNIMDSAYLSLKRAVHNNLEASVFCYPSSRVPESFKCEQTTAVPMAIQLSPAADQLLGFVFCTVLLGFTSNERYPTNLECSCYLEDGEQIEGSSICGYSITELYSDHVFLWYDPLYCKHIVQGVKTRLGKGEDIPNVSFEFFVTYDDDNGERTKHEGLIKECGVHPIYASEQHMELAPELKMKSKWGLDEHGSSKGQVSSRKRKNKGPLTTGGAGESIKEAELASNRAAKVSRSE